MCCLAGNVKTINTTKINHHEKMIHLNVAVCISNIDIFINNSLKLILCLKKIIINIYNIFNEQIFDF